MTMHPPTHNPPPPDRDALRCPGCGYSLHGLCTPETPTGRCPECGQWFVRVQLLERERERAAMPMSLVVMQLLLFPIVLVFVSLFCIGGMSDAMLNANSSEVISVSLMILTPLLGAFLAGGLIAKQYYPRSIAGVAPEDRRGMQRHILLPWLLFFVIEAVLMVVYFVGGCAAILAGLGYL